MHRLQKFRVEISWMSQKGPRYEHYTPLTTYHTTILDEAFNLEVPSRLPLSCLPRTGLDMTKYYRYHHNIDHNIEDCYAQKDKIEELIQAGYLAQFVKRPNIHQAGVRPEGHQEDQHRNQDTDRRRDEVEDQGRQRHHQQDTIDNICKNGKNEPT